MTRRRRRHPLDDVLEPWARERRRMLGISPMQHPAEYLGRCVSTLGVVKDERVAAGTGRGGQHFPEVYVGEQVLVNRAFHELGEDERLAIDAWYVWPGRISDKLGVLAWSEPRFREVLAGARGEIQGWLKANEAAEESYG